MLSATFAREKSTPCLKKRTPVIWVNRRGEQQPEGAKKKPDRVVKNLREAAKILKVL